MLGYGTFIGAVLGFGATLAPEVMDMLRARFSHQREMEAKQQEFDAAKEGWEYAVHANDATLADQKKRIEELTAAARDNDGCRGSYVLEFFKSSVRPTLTYAFFALFVTVKLVSLYHAYHVEHLSTLHVVPLLWDDETETLFSAVISFWFGSRALANKSTNGNNNQSVARIDSDDDLTGSGHVVGEQ